MVSATLALPRLIGNKYGGTRLEFAVSLKFFQYQGRFPKGRQEINQEFIEYVVKQVGVPADLSRI